MFISILFQSSLLLATILTTLATGFILIFVIVIMPGIGSLDNAEFLRAFQGVDKIVQDGQVVFGLVWAGSVLSLITATVLGFTQLEGWARALLILAAVIYLLGTQLTTITVHLPLNNHVKTLNIATLDDVTVQEERQNFEARWTRWNVIRTIFALLASILLMVVSRLL